MDTGSSSKKRKSYNLKLKLKLEAVEYAEMNSNEKAAKRFKVRGRPTVTVYH